MNKYEQMSNFEINKVVAGALGFNCLGKGWVDNADGIYEVVELNGGYRISLPDYCNSPSDAFPIIMKHEIAISPYSLSEDSPEYKEYKGMWFAMKGVDLSVDNKNPLRAAMIVFLLMKEAEKEFVEAQEAL